MKDWPGGVQVPISSFYRDAAVSQTSFLTTASVSRAVSRRTAPSIRWKDSRTTRADLCTFFNAGLGLKYGSKGGTKDNAVALLAGCGLPCPYASLDLSHAGSNCLNIRALERVASTLDEVVLMNLSKHPDLRFCAILGRPLESVDDMVTNEQHFETEHP